MFLSRKDVIFFTCLDFADFTDFGEFFEKRFLGQTVQIFYEAIIVIYLEPVSYTHLVDSVANAMGIALYAMFIAIIIPPAKKSKPIVFTILFAVAIMVALDTIPLFGAISEGFRVIIATLLAAGTAAFLFPVRDETEEVQPSAAEWEGSDADVYKRQVSVRKAALSAL